MVWIFALGIIALAVFHRGFRIVVLWVSGVAVLIVAVSLIAQGLYTDHIEHIKRLEQAKADAAFDAKSGAFMRELRKYCSAPEYDPLAMEAGETPAQVAREQHCAGAPPPGPAVSAPVPFDPYAYAATLGVPGGLDVQSEPFTRKRLVNPPSG